MVTKFKYEVDTKGLVSRKAEYSFTAVEELSERLSGISDAKIISNISAITLKGEAERNMLEIEDDWFRVQSNIQAMEIERKKLEKKVSDGNKYGNPLTPEMQKKLAARIAELNEGTISIQKEFYNHYSRQTITVDEVTQTPFTIALENRTDLENDNPYLAGLRGVKTAPKRPSAKLDPTKEQEIRKYLVRQKIDALVGDDKDLIADMSQALSAIIKKVSGVSVTSDEENDINQYISRQGEINSILTSDYSK